MPSRRAAPLHPTPPTRPCRRRLVLRALLREISAERPRWGYRRAHVRLGELGHHVNRKRVQRLWREEGLRVPARRRKRQRLGESTVPADRLRAQRPDHVWALDFQFDQTADGRVIKLLNVVDEFTREALAIHVARRIDSDQTVNVLERLANQRGAPAHVRCDNGPELTAHALATGVASATPGRRSSSPARRGRTPTWSPSTAACATSCSTSNSSAASPRPSSSSKTGARTTTRTDPTRPWATRPRRVFASAWRATHRGTSHAITNILLRTTSTDSHTRWTNHRGPVSLPRTSGQGPLRGPSAKSRVRKVHAPHQSAPGRCAHSSRETFARSSGAASGASAVRTRPRNSTNSDTASTPTGSVASCQNASAVWARSYGSPSTRLPS